MPTPSANPADLLAAFDRASRVLLTTHVRPDGDALGSVAALAIALRAKGKVADILLLSKLPSKYRFVLEEPGLGHSDLAVGPAPDFASYDTLVVADTGTFSQLPGLEKVIPEFERRGGEGGRFWWWTIIERRRGGGGCGWWIRRRRRRRSSLDGC